MPIFDRIRRVRHPEARSSEHAAGPHEIATHLLPQVNQRVTVTMGEHVPVPSRVEDVVEGELVLAAPALALESQDRVVVTWEHEGVWCSLETRVVEVDSRSAVPTLRISTAGRLSRFDERRTDVRRAIQLPLELRTIRARALRPGRELNTHTVEISGAAVRFATSAPFAPGDLVEARLAVGDAADDVIGARLRVIRVDAVSGSWRSTCTATFDEILRSDRARLLALVEATGRPMHSDLVEEPLRPASTAPTMDGVGGRDEPEQLGSLDQAIEWLRRRG